MPLEDHDNYDACRPIYTKRDLDLNTFSSFMPDRHYDKVTADLQKLELTALWLINKLLNFANEVKLYNLTY